MANGQDKDLQVIAAAGKSFESGTISLDWTIGEVVVAYFDEPAAGLSQGFHQPLYELVSVQSFPEEKGMIEVFPNPISDELNIKMTFKITETGTMELLDLQGKSIWKKPFEGNTVHENYSAVTLPSGPYMLVVSFPNDTRIYSYKLVKI